MGQYWLVVNLDKKEYLHAHDIGHGMKFLEMTGSTGGILAILSALLAAPESMGAGGGDMERLPGVGDWAGDRIVVVGDYTDSGPYANLYAKVHAKDGEYVRISALPKIKALAEA